MDEDRRAEDLISEGEKAINAGTLKLLEKDAEKCERAGRRIFGIAIALGVLLLIGAYWLTEISVADLQDADDPPLMLILLLVRGTLFGGLSAGFLYGVFTIGNAYIDQSTRFRKRLYSAHMLNYAFDTFSEEIKQGNKVKVDDLVRLFYAWNANVDSAFSKVAFQKASKNLVISSKRLAVEDPLRTEDEVRQSSSTRGMEGVSIVGIPVMGNPPFKDGSPDGSGKNETS